MAKSRPSGAVPKFGCMRTQKGHQDRRDRHRPIFVHLSGRQAAELRQLPGTREGSATWSTVKR
ncbi:hypothetical protein GCM10010343_72980 [Streptomyces avidinii]|nr:hypothetical protein GCM10010343_72980 [Streptomyces avidinii]